MSDLTPNQRALVELCRRRAEVLREFITLNAQLTGVDLTARARASADRPDVVLPIQALSPDQPHDRIATLSKEGVCFAPPTPGEASRIRQGLAALLAEVTRLTAQIDQLEDAIGASSAIEAACGSVHQGLEPQGCIR